MISYIFCLYNFVFSKIFSLKRMNFDTTNVRELNSWLLRTENIFHHASENAFLRHQSGILLPRRGFLCREAHKISCSFVRPSVRAPSVTLLPEISKFWTRILKFVFFSKFWFESSKAQNMRARRMDKNWRVIFLNGFDSIWCVLKIRDNYTKIRTLSLLSWRNERTYTKGPSGPPLPCGNYCGCNLVTEFQRERISSFLREWLFFQIEIGDTDFAHFETQHIFPTVPQIASLNLRVYSHELKKDVVSNCKQS